MNARIATEAGPSSVSITASRTASDSNRITIRTLAPRRRTLLRGAALIVLGSLSLILGGSAAPPARVAPPPEAKPAETRPAGTTPAETAPDGATPTAPVPAGLGTVFALLETSQGDIVLELDGDRAPISVENFIAYVKAGHYDGTIFHRVMDNFMIQGGGFNEKLESKSTRPPIKNEWTNGLRNDRGTIAMARLPQPDSATAQFFINVRDNPALNGNADRGMAGYAVFGKVVSGMDVVDRIRAVPTEARGMHQNVPKEAVVIKSAKALDKADVEKRVKAAEDAAKAAAVEKPAEEKPAAKDPSEGKPAGDTGSRGASGSSWMK